MFSKLRNKFLIINMAITSTVMLLALAVIYLITYNNIKGEIQKKLVSVSRLQLANDVSSIVPNDINPIVGNNSDSRGTVVEHKFGVNDEISFNIKVDKDGNIVNIDSFIDMPMEAFNKAVEIAWNDKDGDKTITLENRKWRYLISPIETRIVKSGEKEYLINEDNYYIKFLEVTQYNNTLFQLLTTLIFVAVIMIIVILGMSYYFANRAMKPFEEVWIKQKQFIADASHELKTPLSIINANCDALIASKEETIESQIKWLEYIKIGTDRMTKLINNLLFLARIEDSNLIIEKERINLSNEVNKLINSMELMINENGIKLIKEIDNDIIINSDLEKIKQLIIILLDNAIKYSEKKGEIYVSLINKEMKVILSIKNSGKGISKEDLPKIFDRFYRSDQSRTHENGGYGLGLSIAKTIIDNLGGKIDVTSIENEYTEFKFILDVIN